jgi:hypothetical protein
MFVGVDLISYGERRGPERGICKLSPGCSGVVGCEVFLLLLRRRRNVV